MTVNTTNITSGPYVGNNITDTFDYTFRVTSKDQLQVYETDDSGVQVLLTVDTDYTVNSIGDDTGGTITRVSGALPTSYEWYIRSNYAYTQLTAFASQGGFFPGVHESAMDKLTFLIQQVKENVGRALVSSVTGLGYEVPTPEAGKAIGWNATQDALINLIVDSGSAIGAAQYEEVQVATAAQAAGTDPFTLTILPANDNNLVVYINGVKQYKTAYSYSAGVVTFAGVYPDEGDEVGFSTGEILGSVDIPNASAIPYTPSGVITTVGDVLDKTPLTYDTLALAVADAVNISVGDRLKLNNRVSGGGGWWNVITDVGNALATASGETNIVTLKTDISLSLVIESIMNDKAFGALYDGSTDDTDSIQSALDTMSGVGIVTHGPGTAMIEAVTKNINIPSDTTAFWLPGTEWQAIANSSDSYIVMDIRGLTGAEVHNVFIHNPVITGDRASHIDKSVSSITRSGTTATLTTAVAHGMVGAQQVLISGADQTQYNGNVVVTPTGVDTVTYTVSGSPATPATGTIIMATGEQGHGINISSSTTSTCTNIHIYNPICTDCRGDGIVVRNGGDIHFYDAVADNNWRNGITISKGDVVHFHGTTKSINTNGVAPEAGFDFEPDDASGVLENIVIDKLVTANNDGPACTLNIGDYPNGGSDKAVSITIVEHVDDGSIYGLNVQKAAEGTTEIITGKIHFGSQLYQNNGSCGVYYDDYAGANLPHIFMDNLTIINPNALNSSSITYGAGFAVDRNGGSGLTNTIGNCTINNLRIVDNRTSNQMTRGISAIDNDSSGAELENFYVNDPIEISGYDAAGDALQINMYGAKVSDKYLQTAITLAGSLTVSSRHYRKLTTTDAALFTVTDGITKDNAGMPLELVSTGSGGIRFDPQAARQVYPLSTVVGKYIESTSVGARIELEYNQTDDTWYVLNQQGTWSVEP